MIVVYDSDVCKVAILPAAMVGCYHVQVDDDPEHPMCSSAVDINEAFDEAERIYLEIEETSSQFGVGA